MTQNPTMTVHEMAEALRANLISCSESKLSAMIVAGKFSFAVGTDSGKQNTVIIFREPFYRWLDGMLGNPAIRV